MNLAYIFFIFGSFCFFGQSLQSAPPLDSNSKDFLNFNTHEESIKAAPNPFSDYILIKGMKEPYILKVFDILGKEIFNFNSTSESAGLSTSSYPPGVYMIELTPIKNLDLEKVVFKLIKV